MKKFSFFDRSPSYKLYKSRILRSPDTESVSICLGICQNLPFIYCDPMVLQSSIYQDIDSWAGANARYIEHPNKDDFYSYFHGVVSRLSGLLNSCPATNAAVFNLPRDVSSLTVYQVIDLLPFKNRPSVKDVIERINSHAFDGNDHITFIENPLPCEGGCTVIEKELLGDKISRTGSPASVALVRPSVLPNNAVTRQHLESVLSPAELYSYDKRKFFKWKNFLSGRMQSANSQEAYKSCDGKNQLSSFWTRICSWS